jgi:hypothetical protein
MKLSADMVSIAETPKHVIVNNPYGACGDGVTDDKPFIHKNDGWYYLSWGCFYGMSKSVYVVHCCGCGCLHLCFSLLSLCVRLRLRLPSLCVHAPS